MFIGKQLALHGQIIGVVQHPRADRHHILTIQLIKQVGAALIAKPQLRRGRTAIPGQAGITGKAVAVPWSGGGGP